VSTPAAPLSPSPAARAAVALGALGTLVVAAAVVGVVVAIRVLGAGPHVHAVANASGPFGIGDDVPVSFGFIAVEHAEKVKGLTAKQLGGATHGIGGLVRGDQALIDASVTLTNTTAKPLRYDPRQFRLVARRGSRAGKPSGAVHADIRPGVLQPDAAIDARLTFVTPRAGAQLSMTFDDPAAAKPVVIDLGRSGRATAGERREARTGHNAH
jgi:hypothetical protein